MTHYLCVPLVSAFTCASTHLVSAEAAAVVVAAAACVCGLCAGCCTLKLITLLRLEREVQWMSGKVPPSDGTHTFLSSAPSTCEAYTLGAWGGSRLELIARHVHVACMRVQRLAALR